MSDITISLNKRQSETIDEAKRLLLIERECVKRNDGINCNRQCEKCDLVQDADKIIEMYNNVAEWLEELKAYKEIGTVKGYKDVIRA